MGGKRKENEGPGFGHVNAISRMLWAVLQDSLSGEQIMYTKTLSDQCQDAGCIKGILPFREAVGDGSCRDPTHRVLYRAARH